MDRIAKIDTLIAPAMKTAAAFGLISGGMVDEDTYTRHWNAMEAVVDQARAPLEDDLSALRTELARVTAERDGAMKVVDKWREQPRYYDDCDPGQNDPYYQWFADMEALVTALEP